MRKHFCRHLHSSLISMVQTLFLTACSQVLYHLCYLRWPKKKWCPQQPFLSSSVEHKSRLCRFVSVWRVSLPIWNGLAYSPTVKSYLIIILMWPLNVQTLFDRSNLKQMSLFWFFADFSSSSRLFYKKLFCCYINWCRISQSVCRRISLQAKSNVWGVKINFFLLWHPILVCLFMKLFCCYRIQRRIS
jgi:hypothetical protein